MAKTIGFSFVKNAQQVNPRNGTANPATSQPRLRDLLFFRSLVSARRASISS